MKKRIRKIMVVTLIVIAALALGIWLFMHQPAFGRLPSGDRQARIEQSLHYRDGQFRNLLPTPQMTAEKKGGFFKAFWNFIFKPKEGVRPAGGIPVVNTDLTALGPQEEALVWFGHSSLYMQTCGKRFLLDPVFSSHASPVSFIARAFEGTSQWSAEDMPPVDYLLISHDHWDHLDYPTVRDLRPKVGRVICPLGVGEHLESWGYDPAMITEKDWNEEIPLDNEMTLYTVPSRHFSGRSLRRNPSLWTSFVLRTPEQLIYIGGDGGYGPHFAEAQARFGDFDLAILENGQYDNDWRYIHEMPEQVWQAACDLHARRLLTVHNSKFALARHSWDDPLRRIAAAATADGPRLLTPRIGEKIELQNEEQVFSRWWETVK